jgi:hypothetical protein
MRERRYSSTILDLGTRWRWVVGFTPRPLYPRRKILRYPLDKRLGGRCGEEKNVLPLPGIEPRPYSPSIYQLSYPGYFETNIHYLQASVFFHLWTSPDRHVGIADDSKWDARCSSKLYIVSDNFAPWQDAATLGHGSFNLKNTCFQYDTDLQFT